jgi:hypothetical protein
VVHSVKGNPVRIGDGHAAVIGDETCQIHYPMLKDKGSGWEGAGSRKIRKPEHPPKYASREVFGGRL